MSFFKKPQENSCILLLILRHDSLTMNVLWGFGASTQYALKVSKIRILKVLANFSLVIEPKLKSYKSVQIDELWSYVQNKKTKSWLIYAYSGEEKEILAFAFGRRDSKTVRKLYEKIKALGIEIQ